MRSQIKKYIFKITRGAHKIDDEASIRKYINIFFVLKSKIFEIV